MLICSGLGFVVVWGLFVLKLMKSLYSNNFNLLFQVKFSPSATVAIFAKLCIVFKICIKQMLLASK